MKDRYVRDTLINMVERANIEIQGGSQLPKLEAEILPGHWVEVFPEQLTDDHEMVFDPEVHMGMVEHTRWYIDGDYSAPPKLVRVVRND